MSRNEPETQEGEDAYEELCPETGEHDRAAQSIGIAMEEAVVVEWSHPTIKLTPRLSLYGQCSEAMHILREVLENAASNLGEVYQVIRRKDDDSIAAIFRFRRITGNTWKWTASLPGSATTGKN